MDKFINKTLVLFSLLLLLPASVFVFDTYQKLYTDTETPTLSRYIKANLLSSNDKVDSGITNASVSTEEVKENLYAIKETKDTPTVKFYQTIVDWRYRINVMLDKKNVTDVEVLSCSDNFSGTYDRNWYKLTFFNPWDEKFYYNIAEEFNNYCNIPYKFKFKYDWYELIKEYKLFINRDIKINSYRIFSMLDEYSFDLQTEDIEEKNNNAYINSLTKNDCLNILRRSTSFYWRTEICDTVWIRWEIISLWEDIYMIDFKKNEFDWSSVFRRVFDFNNMKEVENIDKEIFVNSGDISKDFRHRIFPNKLVTNSFIYNLNSWEKDSVFRDFNKKITHFFTKASIIEIEEINSGIKTNVKWIDKNDFNEFFIVKDWYLALIWKNNWTFESNLLKLYYWKIKDWVVNLKSVTLTNTPLWCGKTMWDYITIENWVLTTKWDCNIWIDTLKLSLENEEIISQKKYSF